MEWNSAAISAMNFNDFNCNQKKAPNHFNLGYKTELRWRRQDSNLFLWIFSPAHRPSLLHLHYESGVRIELTTLVLQTNTHPLSIPDITKKEKPPVSLVTSGSV